MHREECDYVLYVITPEMVGAYSIAEAIDDSNKQPHKTLFTYHKYSVKYNRPILEFTNKQCVSLDAVGDMVVRNGGRYFKGIEEVVEFLNSK